MSRVITVRRLAGLGAAILGTLAIVGYYAAPPGAQSYAYDVFGIVCVAAIAVRARSAHTAGRRVWAIFGAGVLLWVFGDLALTELEVRTDGDVPFPSYADGVYLAAYPLIAGATVWAGRMRHPKGDRGLRLETLILVVAGALPVYVYWVRPALAGTDITSLAAAVSAAYPAMDLILVAAAARLALSVRGWSPVETLLALGLLANIVADVAYNITVLEGTYAASSWIDAGWLIAYLLWTAGALHPGAAKLLAAQPTSVPAPLRGRFVFLALVLGSPLAVVTLSYTAGRNLDLMALLATLGVITVGIGLRLHDIARSGSTRWVGHLLLYGAGLVLIAMAVGLTQLQTVTDRQGARAVALLRAEVNLERLGALEADARAGEQTIPAVRRQVDAGVKDIELIFTRNQDEHTPLLLARLHHFENYVNAELALFARGRDEQAEKLDDKRVTPAHDAMRSALATVVRDLRSASARAAAAARIGIVLMLLASGGILTLLFRRFGALRRSAARAEERSQAVSESESRFRAVISGSADIITVIDRDTNVLAHPETVERVLGVPAGTMAERRLTDFLIPEDVQPTREMLASLAERPGGSKTVDWTLLGPGGSRRHAEASVINHLDDPRLCGFVLNVRDVTERRLLELELKHRAFHDHLTGLANRALLEDRLRHVLVRSARTLALHAMVVLDLNDFKAVNDSLGHAAGDELLVHVGQRLLNRVRPSDTLARLGGDEFAVLIEDVPSAEEAVHTAQRLIDVLREPFTIGGRSVVVGASAGVEVSDGSGSTSAEDAAARILANADLAMYDAKRVGSGSVERYATEMHDAVAQRVELRAQIVEGLRRDEFCVHFQPLVELATGRTCGFEALVRWRHPQRGMISPAEFIPVAEQTGLIIELGHFVLREACAQLVTWNAAWDEPRYVSVNVAGPQLHRDAFIEEVASVLRDTGLAPDLLLLEVTETALVQDSDGNTRRMRALRKTGVRLAVDDFGTGYSSLNYLRRFPMDVLKVDKSFVDPVAHGDGDTALVEAIVTMGRALDLEVVAEGIEERDQLDALLELGCPLGQGYLFSRALPASEVEAFMREQTAPAQPGRHRGTVAEL